jgi:hypothetical protein
VAYHQQKVRSVTITNTSQVPAKFSFVDRLSDSREADCIALSWLSICFVSQGVNKNKRALNYLKREVTLESGDAVNATLDLFVDDIALVKALNQTSIELDDVLVLRVTDRRDHFIPIRDSWLQLSKPPPHSTSIDSLFSIRSLSVHALSQPPSESPMLLLSSAHSSWMP